MNLVDFLGYCVMDNITNIRNLKREAIISADKLKWWHFFRNIRSSKVPSNVLFKIPKSMGTIFC